MLILITLYLNFIIKGSSLDLLNNLLRVKKHFHNSLIAKQFNCSVDEVKILQFLTKSYLEDQTSVEISIILNHIFKSKTLQDKFNNLQFLINLNKYGFVELNTGFSFGESRFKRRKYNLLELLNGSANLSKEFIFILENGDYQIIHSIPETPFENIFEFLDNKFKKLTLFIDRPFEQEIIMKLAKRIDEKINLRLEKSSIDMKLVNLLSKLSFDEELVFLAVLSEEYQYFSNYVSEDFKPNILRTDFRDLTALLDLISFKEMDRFTKKNIFEPEGYLFKNNLLVTNDSSIFEQITGENSVSVSENILNQIESKTRKNKRTSKKTKLRNIIEQQDIFELIEPKTGLEEIILPEKQRTIFKTIIRQLDKKVVERLIKWGIKKKNSIITSKIIFHGKPGTGKTASAIALAKDLNRELLHFDCSKILSMYVGESEKNVRLIFDTYKNIVKESGAEPILLLNEADQFLTMRTSATSGSVSQMYNQMQNIFLEQIENFEGILVATTNMIDNLDKAFSRRFNYKIEFKPPTEKERIEIWKKHLPKNATFSEDFSVEKLAKYNLTGGQIDLIMKNTAFKVATKENPVFELSDFIDEVQQELKNNFDNDRVMGFLKD